MAKKRNYWLMKSEPGDYSIRDLETDGETYWDGVRNYQARNIMRDQMRIGDGVLYYHSNAKPPGIIGLAEVTKEAFPDPSQFEPDNKYYDPKSTLDNPRWMCVSIGFVGRFDELLSLHDLRKVAELEGMALLRRGQRLSVQPVTPAEWATVLKLAGR